MGKSTVRHRSPSSTRPGTTRRKRGPLSRVLSALEMEVASGQADYPFGPGQRYSLLVATSLELRRRVGQAFLPARQTGMSAPLDRPRLLHDLLPDSTVFLAERDGRSVGTATVSLDGPLGLPLDALLPGEAASLRRKGRKSAELWGLNIAKDLGPASRTVLVALLRAVVLAARKIGGAKDLLIAAPASRKEFCRRLGAELVVLSAAGAVFRAELDDLDGKLFRRHAGWPGARDLHRALHDDEDCLKAWLRQSCQPLSEPDLVALLAERREAFAALPANQRHAFEDLYLAYDLQKVFERRDNPR